MQQARHTNIVIKLKNRKILNSCLWPPEAELLLTPRLTKVLKSPELLLVPNNIWFALCLYWAKSV